MSMFRNAADQALTLSCFATDSVFLLLSPCSITLLASSIFKGLLESFVRRERGRAGASCFSVVFPSFLFSVCCRACSMSDTLMRTTEHRSNKNMTGRKTRNQRREEGRERVKTEKLLTRNPCLLHYQSAFAFIVFLFFARTSSFFSLSRHSSFCPKQRIDLNK